MASSRLKYKIFNNKKGFIDEFIPAVVFIIVAALAIFLLRISEHVKSDSLIKDIQVQKDIIYGHNLLIEYLLQIDEQDNSKADTISKAVIENNNDIIKQELAAYFGKKLAGVNWYIDVKDSENNLIFPTLSNAQYSPQEQYSSTQEAYQVDMTLVPISGTDYIYIELFFVR